MNLSDSVFVVLPVFLLFAFAAGVWLSWARAGSSRGRASIATIIALAAGAAWMTFTWRVAASGALRRWNDTPPPIALLVLAIILLAFRIAFSTTGRRLAQHVPLWALVAVQAFRFPLELAMHSMYAQGVMPIQMSYSGLNFDIVTGISAVLVAWLLAAGRVGRRTAAVWNTIGLLLLVNIVTVAILSTPRFAYFGEDRVNVWVTYPPYVWLPAVMVVAALAGHLVIFRALRFQR